MKILFIGGTGIISSACTQLVAEQGHDLVLLNRGMTRRAVPDSVQQLHCDIRKPASVLQTLGEGTFDAVVNWIGFTPEHIETDLELFKGRTGQYIFISSASAYQTPPDRLPITENTPLSNPFWGYSRAKIACESRLMKAYNEEGFPVTIVRPSHTYDRTLLPFEGGYTVLNRMKQGRRVIVHGDGSSLWVLTHHRDFAVGFTGLLAKSEAIGQAFHITSDELLTWNQIYQLVARAAGTEAQLVHIPSDKIAAADPDWGASLLGDKTHSVIFDNSRIRNIVPSFTASTPFSAGAEEIVSWYESHPDQQQVNPALDRIMDELIADYTE